MVGTRVNARGEQEELATLMAPDCFGEMALMDNSPRHASVVAKGEVHCLTLDRAHFVKLLGPLKSILQAHSCLHVLRSIELFSELTDTELESIVNAMHSEKFSRGTAIIKEGTGQSRVKTNFNLRGAPVPASRGAAGKSRGWPCLVPSVSVKLEAA